MFANQFAPNDGRLKILYLAPEPEYKKSDAFIIQYGSEVFTIDGGMSGSHCMNDRLMQIRAEFLKDHPELIDDTSCKLRIGCFISHYHTDHVFALIDPTALNEYISISNVYHGPATKVDPGINKISKNGDEIFRPRLEEVLREHHPDCKMTEVDYGKENAISFRTHSGLEHEVEFTCLPPSADWGISERYEYMKEHYDIVEKPQRTNLYTLNSSSMWVHIRLGANTFLFTGDTIKRRGDLFDEALDEMTALYAEEYSPVTVLKYVHHGLSRENAVADMLRFNPSNIVFTSAYATAPNEIREKAPEESLGIGFFSGGKSDLTVECSAKSDVSFTQQ